MSDVSTRISSALRNGRVVVSLTAGLCLILLTIVLKNVLHVPAERLSSDIILYIIIYMGLAITVPFIGETEPVSRSRMMLWVVVIIIITLAIIGVYAI
jgi:hypothetical protein